jgi:hypothetical protein
MLTTIFSVISWLWVHRADHKRSSVDVSSRGSGWPLVWLGAVAVSALTLIVVAKLVQALVVSWKYKNESPVVVKKNE